MIMPSQQRPPQQSGLSLPLQHSIHCIHCGATTNFNVNVWSTTVGSLHEFLFAKYKMKYFIQYFQTGDILIPSGFSREFSSENRKTGNEKVTNSREFPKPGSRFPSPSAGVGRSGVRLVDGFYQDLVNWYCNLLTGVRYAD